MPRKRVYTKHIKHSSGSRQESVSYAAVAEGENLGIPDYFALQGTGVERTQIADTLGELLEVAKSEVQVSEGRRTKDEISKGVKITSTHFDKLISQIQKDIDEMGEDTTAQEWIDKQKE